MRTLSPFWTRGLTSDLFREMDRMFADFPANVPTYDEREFSPATEVAETDEHYILSVDLPGLKKEDIQIEMVDKVLTISGERKREQRVENHKVQRFERSYGSFKRSFVLPTTVQSDKIEAHYENGVLELYLPKAQEAQARKIEVQSGKGSFFDKLLGGKKDLKDIGSNDRAS